MNVTWTTGSDGKEHVSNIGSTWSWSHKSLSGALDLSGFTYLTELRCNDNQLTSLNFSGDTALRFVNSELNRSLTSVNFTGVGSSLESLILDNCSISSLDVTGMANLKTLYVQSNSNLSSVTGLSGCTLLERFFCASDNFTTIDLRNFTHLERLTCGGNANLTSLNVKGCTAMTWLECSDINLSSLDLAGNTLLQTVTCVNIPNLETLDITGDNNITMIATNGCTSLQSIKSTIGGGDIQLTAVGDGYLDMNYNATDLHTTARPNGAATFVNWTNPDTNDQISSAADFSMTPGSTYKMAANFQSPTPTPTPTPTPAPTPAATPVPGGTGTITVSAGTTTLYTGGRTTLTPSIKGGTWQYDAGMVSLTQNADGSFTVKALKSGTATLHYTVGWASTDVTLTIGARSMPQTGQDYTAVFVLIALAACAATSTVVILYMRKRAKQK